MENGKKHLVTTQSWFFGPDGNQYRAIWGTVQVKEAKDHYGFTPNRHHANWIVEIGDGDKKATVTGCEVLYALRCEERPTEIPGTEMNKETGRESPINSIYFTE